MVKDRSLEDHLGYIYFYLDKLNFKLGMADLQPEHHMFTSIFKKQKLEPALKALNKADIKIQIPPVEFNQLITDTKDIIFLISTFFEQQENTEYRQLITNINSVQSSVSALKNLVNEGLSMDFSSINMLTQRLSFLVYEINLLTTYAEWSEPKYDDLSLLLSHIDKELFIKPESPYTHMIDSDPERAVKLIKGMIIEVEHYLEYKGEESHIHEAARIKILLKQNAIERINIVCRYLHI